MKDPLPPLVERVIQRLIRNFKPEKIVLFGSYAKGTQLPDSDVDLLVIANVPEKRSYFNRRARQLAADCFPHVDIVLATPQEVGAIVVTEPSFLLSIMGTGVTIYPRPESEERTLR